MYHFPKAHPLFDFEPSPQNTLVLDLSVHNPDPELSTVQDTASLERYIAQKCAAQQKDYAYGGYAENRVIYQRFPLFKNNREDRCWHLGIDFWAPAHTPVRAPYAALIHSIGSNDKEGDYGATIILQHDIGLARFYTLFGHLSEASLAGKKPGQHLAAGTHFAALGPAAENGGWPPHLHFQVIMDIGDYQGDYPGVASAEKRKDLLANCPDPEKMLQWHLQ